MKIKDVKITSVEETNFSIAPDGVLESELHVNVVIQPECEVKFVDLSFKVLPTRTEFNTDESCTQPGQKSIETTKDTGNSTSIVKSLKVRFHIILNSLVKLFKKRK